MEILGLTSNYLAAVGLLYAIFLGFTYQEASERLHGLSAIMQAEASALAAIVDLTLLTVTPTERQLARIRVALDEYLQIVLSEEAQPGVERINNGSAAHISVGTRLRLEVVRALNEVAIDGVDDALDRTTIDSVHEEIRAVLCARSTRVTLTNQRMPRLHWVVLSLMSVMTILGVALINISIAPGTSAFLTFIIAFVIPLSFSVVVDMATPFDGVWTADVSPLRGVREHALSQLNAAAIAAGRGGAAPKARAGSDVMAAAEAGAPLAV